MIKAMGTFSSHNLAFLWKSDWLAYFKLILIEIHTCWIIFDKQIDTTLIFNILFQFSFSTPDGILE